MRRFGKGRTLPQQRRDVLRSGDHRIVPGAQLVVVDDAVGLNGPGLPERLVADAVDVGTLYLWGARAQAHRLAKGANRVRPEPGHHPALVLFGLQSEELRRR